MYCFGMNIDLKKKEKKKFVRGHIFGNCTTVIEKK